MSILFSIFSKLRVFKYTFHCPFSGHCSTTCTRWTSSVCSSADGWRMLWYFHVLVLRSCYKQWLHVSLSIILNFFLFSFGISLEEECPGYMFRAWSLRVNNLSAQQLEHFTLLQQSVRIFCSWSCFWGSYLGSATSAVILVTLVVKCYEMVPTMVGRMLWEWMPTHSAQWP